MFYITVILSHVFFSILNISVRFCLSAID